MAIALLGGHATSKNPRPVSRIQAYIAYAIRGWIVGGFGSPRFRKRPLLKPIVTLHATFFGLLYPMDKMRGYSVEKRRVDRFEPEIKRVLGEHLIQTADFERDTTQATDLLILSVHPVTIGCRVRRHNYVYSFSNEFTIRAEIPKGRPTELQKVLDGWCDYGFYAFADQTDVHLLQWTLYSFDVFRETLRAMPNSGSDFVEKKLSYNEDGSSRFATFKWDEFPAEMIIAQRLVEFEPCDNKRCYNGKEWYRVPNATNKWRTCLRCLGFEKVLKTDTDSDDSA